MRVLIIDDHPLMRLGVRELILRQWPGTAVAECASLGEALQRARGQPWDIAVLDLALPDASGIEGLVKLHRAVPDLPILVLSLHDETAYASRALQLGASGYLTKDHATAELLTAIQAVRGGQRYISRALAARLADLLSGAPPPTAPHEMLSPQEYRVMLLIASGLGASEIARLMHLSVKTIGTYRARIIEKTGLEGTAEMARYCSERGLLRGWPPAREL
jgi:two-component system, NarL family, invasion response regulator UvrY